MGIRRRTIGLSAGHSGQPPTTVEAWVVQGGTGHGLEVWSYGATLVELVVPDRHGELDNVVCRLPSLPDYECQLGKAYLGATMGRYARSVAEARFSLDGVIYELDVNEGRNHVHGGIVGWDRLVWEGKAESVGGHLQVHFHLERPAGDQRYPGGVVADTWYRLDTDGSVTFEHRVTTDAPTIVDVTNHALWNLGGERTTVDGLQLAINAERVLLVNDELLPVGRPRPVEGTPLDFRSARPIGTTRLDNCFMLDDPAWAAELHDPRSGRVMAVVTDQPGLAVYSGDGLRSPRTGLSLQTGGWPNSPNRSDCPSPRLNPGDVYCHRTTHHFSIR